MGDVRFLSWRDISGDFWRWKNFTPEEFASRGSGALLVVPEFMDKIQALRAALGRPMVITSGYRTPEHNALVSNTGRSGPHTTGRAADVSIHGEAALDLLSIVKAHGFTGIGISQKGPIADRFIHLDDLPKDIGRPRPWTWSY